MNWPLIPPKATFTIPVRISKVERGKPTPYALDFEWEWGFYLEYGRDGVIHWRRHRE